MLLGKIIDCKQIALKIKSEVIEEVQKVKQENNITPTVVSILVGNDYGSIYYQKMQDKTARELGINFIKANFDKNVTEEELLSCIRKFNDDKLIHGIMVLLPFPGNINEKKVLNAIILIKILTVLQIYVWEDYLKVIKYFTHVLLTV